MSVVVPKKGKKRMVQKRPAARKTKLWKQISYVRDKLALPSRGQRKDQIKWKRTLPELLKATGTDIIRILRADKLLIKWEGKRCRFCSSSPTTTDLSSIGAAIGTATSV